VHHRKKRSNVFADWDNAGIMRTSIEIDDRLMREARRCSGSRTKKAAVERALQLLVGTYAQGAIARLAAR
jgi:Arc/MetJ family transcription regulator